MSLPLERRRPGEGEGGPERALEPELMDGELPAVEAARALGDLDRVNRWLQGTGAVVRTLLPHLVARGGSQLLVDLGTGTGAVVAALARRARRRGAAVTVVGVDRRLAHLVAGRARGIPQLRVVASADALPFARASADWVVSSLLFHHFDGRQNLAILDEMVRSARRGAAVVDLRRSRFAARLVRWLFPLLGVGSVARHDGALSIAQSWTVEEVRQLLGRRPGGFEVVELRRRFPFRFSLVLAPRETPTADPAPPAAGRSRPLP